VGDDGDEAAGEAVTRRRGPVGEDPWDIVAAHHLHRVVSVVDDAERSPLVAHLDAIPNRDRLVAADLGCGSGPLLPLLVSRFGEVVAIDASRRMLELARARMSEPLALAPTGLVAEVEFHRCSLERLNAFTGRFDVCITLNSVIMPASERIARSLRSIRRSLRGGGTLIGVFPAVESMAEAVQFCYRRELHHQGSHRRSWPVVRRRLRTERRDFALGLVDAGPVPEKYYGREELAARLGEAGLQPVEWGRVVYRRELAFDGVAGYGGRPPRVWHHFVRCQAEPAVRGATGRRSRARGTE